MLKWLAPSLASAQAVQNIEAGIAIGDQALRGLKQFDGGHGIWADFTIDLVGVMPGRREQRLQLDPFIGFERAVFAGPFGLDRWAALDAVGKMADADHIGIGGVICLDRGEVLEDQEGRAARACG